ncbi:calcium/sodium antiporter [Arhodomonas sp. SL1]|uniref:calcium/sodium antiporter n=1 Tax=Arhodomonas sp. SL1 TaxID=3425691 RepID=UPI003F882660
MNMTLMLVGGLLLLIIGAEFLVRGAVRLASHAGVSPLLIGLTVVGFGTSMPELVTSVQGALSGSPGVAVGNIVGSNLFNLLVILGVAALIQPLAVPSSALRRDGILVIATAALFVGFGYFLALDRAVGTVLLGLLLAYLVFAWRQERKSDTPATEHTAPLEKAAALEGVDRAVAPSQPPTAGTSWVTALPITAGGLIALVIGARLFVGGSIALAHTLGISETVIGLTIVAAGTSMPELATSAMAAFRRQHDVAIGNVLGSNIYNILGIGGVTAWVAPTTVPETIAVFDGPVMLGVSIVVALFLWSGHRLTRVEGGLLVLAYVLYLWVI